MQLLNGLTTNSKSCALYVLIVLIYFALQPTSTRAEGRESEDNRVPIDLSLTPQLKGIVAVESRFELSGQTMLSSGTGFFISPCHVMTNVHVVDNYDVADGEAVQKNDKSALLGKRITVRGRWRGLAPTAEYGVTAEGQVIAVGSFVAKRGERPSSYSIDSIEFNGDWAILQLDQSVASADEILKIQPVLPSRALELTLDTAGFPGDKYRIPNPTSLEDKAKALQPVGVLGCRVVTANATEWQSTCSAYHGQSGSPVVAKGYDGTFYAVAMVTRSPSGGVADETAILNPLNTFSVGSLNAFLNTHQCNKPAE